MKQEAHGRTEIVPMIEMAAKAAIECLAMIIEEYCRTLLVFLDLANASKLPKSTLIEVASTYVGISRKNSVSAHPPGLSLALTLACCANLWSSRPEPESPS